MKPNNSFWKRAGKLADNYTAAIIGSVAGAIVALVLNGVKPIAAIREIANGVIAAPRIQKTRKK